MSNRNLNRLILYSAVFFSFTCLGWTAPIVLQATTLTSGTCSSTVSGANFTISQTITFGCAHMSPLGTAGILWPSFDQATFDFDPPALGTVTVPENPGRQANAFGGQVGSTIKFVEPTVPESFTGTVPINVVLSGSLQVCLLPAGVSSPSYPGPCDPAYANFATININVAGVDEFTYHNGLLLSESFSGTAAAAPEPATAAMLGGGLLLLVVLFVNSSRSRTSV